MAYHSRDMSARPRRRTKQLFDTQAMGVRPPIVFPNGDNKNHFWVALFLANSLLIARLVSPYVKIVGDVVADSLFYISGGLFRLIS